MKKRVSSVAVAVAGVVLSTTLRASDAAFNIGRRVMVSLARGPGSEMQHVAQQEFVEELHESTVAGASGGAMVPLAAPVAAVSGVGASLSVNRGLSATA